MKQDLTVADRQRINKVEVDRRDYPGLSDTIRAHSVDKEEGKNTSPCDNVMDTKRCTYCHKLLRADAQTCSRCGHVFLQKKPRTTTRRFWTRPSIPPASPHRAGHYSGLHPEDQPYQSSLIAVPHTTTREYEEEEIVEEEERHTPQQEPEYIVLPMVNAQHRLELYNHFAPTVYTGAIQAQTVRKRRSGYLRRLIPILLMLSCILFLLASGIIAFVLLAKHTSLAKPVLLASPQELRTSDTCLLAGSGLGINSLMVFTYNKGTRILDGNGQPLEVHTDNQGSFSLQWQIPASWTPGPYTIYATDEAQKLTITTTITVRPDALASMPPMLQLSASTLDLGSGAPGTTSRQFTVLNNNGGGQVTWQGSSDAPWLTVSPNSATFSGSQSVTAIVNRATLKAGHYQGHISFKQKDSTGTQQLLVTMQVTPAPAAFSVSSAALTFAASSSQNPQDQTLVVQNSGGQSLIWHSSTSTGSGVGWLTITPQQGRLAPGSSADVTVHAQSSQLAVGMYQGSIDFSGDVHTEVAVSLNVIAPGNLVASPPELNFSTVAGQSPVSKSLTLQNSGGLALDWTLTPTVDSGHWLSASPMTGTLAAGTQTTLTVNINGSVLSTGSYQGQLTLSEGSITQQVAVAVTVTAPPSAAINVQTSTLNFTTTTGTNPAAQTFRITNTGNATLNWTTMENNNGATFAPVTPAQGSLATGSSATLTVSPSVASTPAGTLQTLITILDSDSGSSVPSQRVAVTITIQAQITVSSKNIHFDSNTSLDQTLTVSNAGASSLTWTTAQLSSSVASWLTLDISSGTLAASASSTLHLHCDASGLTAGTYTTSLVISDSNATADTQTVSIIFVVH